MLSAYNSSNINKKRFDFVFTFGYSVVCRKKRVTMVTLQEKEIRVIVDAKEGRQIYISIAVGTVVGNL